MSEKSGIAICSTNTYYWQYDGKPRMLLGGSVEDNLFQVANLEEELDKLARAGGNYVRCTMSCRDEGDVWPFDRNDDESYDLEKWNPEFWRRFEDFLVLTAERDIVVQIEMWATFDYYRDNWARNPFNPENNVNYTADESDLPEVVETHPVKTDNNFFWSVPAEENNRVVLNYQECFADRILDSSLEYDHILYCMDNETSVTPEWGAYWAQFIKDRAEKRGKTVYTTEMWDAHDLDHPQHDNTFDHPELYDFVDISQNNHQTGQTHYDNALRQRRRIADNPRPMNNVKIYGGNYDYGDERDGVERFWRNIFAGTASARFHRPPAGIGISSLAQKMIRSAREVTDSFDLINCIPHPELLADREDNEAFLLSDRERWFALYFPAAGVVSLRTEDCTSERLVCRWYAIDESGWKGERTVANTGELALKTPGEGQWAAIIEGK